MVQPTPVMAHILIVFFQKPLGHSVPVVAARVIKKPVHGIIICSLDIKVNPYLTHYKEGESQFYKQLIEFYIRGNKRP